MFRGLLISKMDFTSLLVIGGVIVFISLNQWVGEKWFIYLPDSFHQLNTIFLSIVIEAIPFVLIGVFIAGFIQIFITEDHIQRFIPKNKMSAVTMSCILGGFFPACECGIVPITRRLAAKGVPIYAAVGFLLTGPLINPIVVLSTYMAFGNEAQMAALRMGIGFIAAMIIALVISLFFQSSQLKHANIVSQPIKKESFIRRIEEMVKHSIDEFFDMGKFLIMGAFIAAFLQTYVSMNSLFLLGDSLAGSTVVMMGLAYVLSLCSEADAFIGASFRYIFPSTSILAFLIYGPMIDLKNTMMLLGAFKPKFVITLVGCITLIVFVSVMAVTLL
ncbi:permease [Salibacterium aidingense]|uniref:permease n=1 Tax=Salibacterium aidingense TaxID=384933 RepID=UPI0004255634|nr:permease [Salibacterium aidingense]